MYIFMTIPGRFEAQHGVVSAGYLCHNTVFLVTQRFSLWARNGLFGKVVMFGMTRHVSRGHAFLALARDGCPGFVWHGLVL